MKIIDYKMIRCWVAHDIAASVKKELLEEWQPFGAPHYEDGVLYQAMVKYEENLDASSVKNALVRNQMPDTPRKVLVQLVSRLSDAKGWYFGQWHGSDWEIEGIDSWADRAYFIKWDELPED